MKLEDVKNFKEEVVIKYLEQLIEKLDELDGEDYFGTEGWRHSLMGED